MTEPLRVLKEAGAEVHILSPQMGLLQGFRHHEKGIQVPVDRTLDEVDSRDYDAVVLPGGALNADQLRIDDRAKSFVRETMAADKPLAVICHGSWLLVSADLLRGRRLTSYVTIRDDLQNAGAHWVDEEVVLDGNLISSRKPDDLPAFNRELLRVFVSRAKSQAQSKTHAA